MVLRKNRKRRSKRKRSRKKRSRRKRSRTKRSRKKRNRKTHKKVTRGNVRQRGGQCQNPFVGKGGKVSVPQPNYYSLNSDNRLAPAKLTAMKGGGLWRDLGFHIPKAIYNDSLTWLTNSKNTWVGNRPISTSDVLDQPIASPKTPQIDPVNFEKYFNEADNYVAKNILKP